MLYYLEKNVGHFGIEKTYEQVVNKKVQLSKFLKKELEMEQFLNVIAIK